jgi:leucyl aminopeptidase
MIEFQSKFLLAEETKDLVLLANDYAKDLLKDLDIDVLSLKDELFTSIHTFGKLKAKRVHLIGETKLHDDESLTKLVNQLDTLKDDALILTDGFDQASKDNFAEMVEKLVSKRYVLDTFKSKKSKEKSRFFVFGDQTIKEALNQGIIYGESINRAKDLVNTPYNHMKAKDLAEHAKFLEKYDGVKVNIYERKQIEEMNMGAYLGVNKGSTDDPYLIFIEYKAKDNNDEPVALVGKGVMYDTGGYSLKTPVSMPGMKFDMAGAAAVISAVEGIARLKLDAHVLVVVAATDNRIGDNAMVPDDIITSANGKTIEIISTDAEGRLTLADAVWFAQKQGAKKIIDVATLTGAIMAALGSYYTGAFTNNQDFFDAFKKVTEVTKEKIWQMPISKEYHAELKSEVADLKNKGGRLGGASQAAAFIEEFIDEDTAWIHLDIAGTSSDKKKNSNGVMVKSFMKFFS